MPDEKKAAVQQELINYDYIKASSFHVIHSDGAFLALTANGGVTVSFYSERQPIPRRVVHEVKADGTLGREVRDKRVARDAIIRDVEISAIMSVQAAKSLRDALGDIIATQEKVAKMSYEEIKRELENPEKDAK